MLGLHLVKVLLFLSCEKKVNEYDTIRIPQTTCVHSLIKYLLSPTVCLTLASILDIGDAVMNKRAENLHYYGTSQGVQNVTK